MRKQFLFLGILAAFYALSSCSDDEVSDSFESPPSVLGVSRAMTVDELTDQLRLYDRDIGLAYSDAPFKSLKPVTFTTKDKIKIALADVKGGLRGAGGGVPGVIVGAAVQSLIKAAEIYAWKNLKALVGDAVRNNLVLGNGSFSFADSVGYYHNAVEACMYEINSSSHLMTSYSLIGRADLLMRHFSSGYAEEGGLGTAEKKAIAERIENVRNIADDNLSFDAYLGRLKAETPEDAGYLDFAAEYLYTVFYANVDLEEYTGEVVLMIKNSNIDIDDSSLLYKCIQIAHASVVYARNTTLTEN